MTAKVSVIISTWNRGKFILPTIQSVLPQTFQDFEIIVVGDGCDDNTEEVVRPYLSTRFRWVNLKHNCGSQSFANNVGIAMARGTYIAYLGHDDIWAPKHLQTLVDIFEKSSAVDFAVAGMVLHGPPGSGIAAVTGLFTDGAEAREKFFPPSSVMHKRAIVKHTGLWTAPWRSNRAVDSQFQLRAVERGFGFGSTGQITVHKFAAGQRYLSYILPDDTEQRAMLLALRTRNSRVVDTAIADAKRNRTYLTLTHAAVARPEIGVMWRLTRAIRGLDIPAVQRLHGPITIPQSGETRALDWNDFEAAAGFRWSGPNPRPRILIPFSSEEMVSIHLEFHYLAPQTLEKLKIAVNGVNTRYQLQMNGPQVLVASLNTRLQADKPTILELHAPSDNTHSNQRYLALGAVKLSPTVNP
jgi:glycosyltransferase involved in cell wall biosynthesis